jgi:hypothetical protein
MILQLNVSKGQDMIELKPETVAHIVFGARQLFADDELREVLRDMEDSEPGSGEQIDLDDEALERAKHTEHEMDPVYNDLASIINNLPGDFQAELIALTWLGRGDSTKDEWDDLMNLARERRSDHTADYLLNMPLLAEYLQEGLDAFGHSVEDFEVDQ